jgi:5'-nucleotidase / UDP-sugar diphosphatase
MESYSKEALMRAFLPAVAVVPLLIVGCARTPDSDIAPVAGSTQGSVLDVQRAPAPAHPPVMSLPVEPVAAAPAFEPAPVITETPIAAQRTHSVARGDTLYGLARQYYGDGKQWQRIADANPGINPSALRVGQALVIP